MSQPLSLHVESMGQADRPAVVMLHGLYGSGNNWRSIGQHAQDQHHVLLPDLRNHGRSPHSPEMDYRQMAADVVALLDAHAISQASVVGHSMGGKVAMAMALSAPERVARLMVVDIAPIAYDHSAEHGGIIQAMQALNLAEIQDRKAADAELAELITQPMVRQFLLTNLYRNADGDWQWRIPLGILADQLPLIQGWPEELYGMWGGPATFVHGARSNYVDTVGQAAILQQFPSAQIEAVAGAGHWVHAEAPQAFLTQLNNFLT